MSQLTSITFHSDDSLYRRWPYQAKVMNTFETVSSITVFIPVIYRNPERTGRKNSTEFS
jgi:hypothetical protein